MENVDNAKTKMSNEESTDVKNEKSEKRDHPKHIDIIIDEYGKRGEGLSIALCGIKPTEAIGYLTVALEELKRDVIGKAIRPNNSFGAGMMAKIFADLLHDKEIASEINEVREKAEREFKNGSKN